MHNTYFYTLVKYIKDEFEFASSAYRNMDTPTFMKFCIPKHQLAYGAWLSRSSFFFETYLTKDLSKVTYRDKTSHLYKNALTIKWHKPMRRELWNSILKKGKKEKKALNYKLVLNWPSQWTYSYIHYLYWFSPIIFAHFIKLIQWRRIF